MSGVPGMITTVLVLGGIAFALGGLLLSAQARLRGNDNELIDAIDALLPQTQCAQCGYPGCRPYAEAVAAGARIDLCPPGGDATFEALKALLGRSEGASPPAPEPLFARVREADCIGCFLCIRACPVDAIIGAPGYMHTVIEEECTGCELCVPACPVDCIDLIPAAPIATVGPEGGRSAAAHRAASTAEPRPGRHSRGSSGQANTFRHESPGGPGRALESSARNPATHREASRRWEASIGPGIQADSGHGLPGGQPCIGCNRCEPVCPAGLAPRELLWMSAAGKWDAASGLGLGRCIECRLCDRACPSGIPLAAVFANGKRTLADQAENHARAARARARFEARTARLAAEQDAARARRAERLTRRSRQGPR